MSGGEQGMSARSIRGSLAHDQAPDGTRDQIGQGVDIVAQTEAQAGALASAGSQTQTQTQAQAETQAAIQARARIGRP